jgi:RNA ligase (TIGR02306 family)
MSTFKVEVTKIRAIEQIEGADTIQLAVVGDYRSVVRKNTYRAGDLAVYIPEAAIVPDNILEVLGLTGRLAGKQKNRVKAIRLRGCLSQGILYPVDSGQDVGGPFIVLPTEDGVGNALYDLQEGQDLAEEMGITKWEPPIPTYMEGEIYNAGTNITVKYDIDNFKSYPDILQDGEDVVMTEKLHGTFCGVGIVPEKDYNDKLYKSKFVVFNKGNGAKGISFTNGERATGNVYFRALLKANIFNKLEEMVARFNITSVPHFVFGEVFGQGIQDLQYGSEVSFRAFDSAKGYRDDLEYHGVDKFITLCNVLEIDRVPELYRGPFSKEKMIEMTTGKETISGKAQHIREGVVIKPVVERWDSTIGRVILKSVSEDYLMRGGVVTEYN